MARSDYSRGRILGRGGMGVVVEVTHRRLGVLAAMKCMPDVDATREARLMARVDHPNVIRVFDAGHDAEGSFLVMQRAVGPLTQVRDAEHWRRALADVLRGLAAAHAHDLLHLDLKPGNILSLGDDTCALADFGLAVVGRTAAQAFGTPSYMAPEAFEGAADARSDLYSVGCVAFALLTGHPPFRGSWSELARAHAQHAVPAVETRLDCTPEWVEWMMRCLAKDPDARYAHPAQALADLLALPSSAQPVQRGQRVALAPTLPLAATLPRGSSGGPATPRKPGTVTNRSASPSPLPEHLPAWPRRMDRSLAGAGLLGLRPLPFLGREAELQQIWKALRAVERDGRTRVLQVVGPLSADRQRLVHQAARLAWSWGAARRPTPGRVALLLEPTPAPECLVLVDERVEGAEVLNVPPRSLSDCRSILAAWISMEPRLVTELASLCGGDITLAQQVVTRGVANHQIRWDGQQLVSERTLQLPDELLDPWRSKVARVPRTDALQAAACAGRQVPRALLTRVFGANDVEEQVVAARLACSTPTGFDWVSGGARAAVHVSDPVALHARLAEATEGWARGMHLLRAGRAIEAADQLLPDVSVRAGAGEMVETEVVLRELSQALAGKASPQDARWAQLWDGLATLGPTHLGYGAAESFGQKALEVALTVGSDDVRNQVIAQSSTRLSWLFNMRGLPRQARPHVERSIRLTPHTASVAQNLGYVLIGEGASEDALAAFELAARRSHAKGRVYSRWSVLGAAAIAKRYLGRYEEAFEQLQVCRKELTSAGFHSAEADNLCCSADALRFAGDLDGALELYTEAVRVSGLGQARADLGFEIGLALCHLERGDAVLAEAILCGCEQRVGPEQGPTWQGLIGLHRLAARVALGHALEQDEAVAVVTPLLGTGYVDPDLPRSARSLGSIGPVLHGAIERWEEQLAFGRTAHPEALAALHGQSL